MTCMFCRHGSTHPGVTTVTLQRGDSIILFRRVPAQLCDNCGEPYVADIVSESLLRRAEEAVARGVDLEVVHFAA